MCDESVNECGQTAQAKRQNEIDGPCSGTLMCPQPIATVDDLGIQGSAYLYALLHAQDERLSVTPTARFTLAIMSELKSLQVIDAPWPKARWELEPRAEVTPIEGLQWRYVWDAYTREFIVEALLDFLEWASRQEINSAWRLQLWQALSVSEIEQYLEQQLIRHKFEAVWARDFDFVYKERRPAMSIARWRYCCWAAVRHGASVSQQQDKPDMAAVRSAIHNELRRRADKVASGAWPNCIFPPSNLRPTNALGRLFLEVLSDLQDGFWLIPANDTR